MSVRDYKVLLCERQEIQDFIELWHYSHNINGVISDYCFKLMDGDRLIGGMIYGRLAMRNQYKRYAENEADIMELRRLCCIDDTPKNTESFFIGASLRWLAKNTKLKTIVSYADSTYGHTGIIYKASNFTLTGLTSPLKVIKRLKDSKLYHDKAIRTKYKGNLKPFAVQLKKDLEDGKAVWIQTKAKYIYLYELR